MSSTNVFVLYECDASQDYISHDVCSSNLDRSFYRKSFTRNVRDLTCSKFRYLNSKKDVLACKVCYVIRNKVQYKMNEFKECMCLRKLLFNINKFKNPFRTIPLLDVSDVLAPG